MRHRKPGFAYLSATRRNYLGEAYSITSIEATGGVWRPIFPSNRSGITQEYGVHSPVSSGTEHTFPAGVVCRDSGSPGTPMALGLFRDITERKRAEAACEREHRTLKYLLQSSDHERQPSPTKSMMAWPSILPAPSCSSMFRPSQRGQAEKAADAYDAGMTMLRQSHSEARH